MIDVAEFQKRIAPIPRAADVWVTGGIYGESGTGKTSLAITKKAGGKVLFANLEDGYLSISGSGIDKVDLRTYKDFRDLFVYLKTAKHPYDTLFVDSFTEAQKFVTAEIAQRKVSNNEAKDPFKWSPEDYGLGISRLRQWMWDLRGLPMHVFYIMLARSEKKSGDVIVRDTLALSPDLARTAFSYCSLIGYMALDSVTVAETREQKVVRKLYLQSVGDFVAKARLPLGVTCPTHILQPTLDKIIALYRNEGTAKSNLS